MSEALRLRRVDTDLDTGLLSIRRREVFFCDPETVFVAKPTPSFSDSRWSN
jgi:hypothetical protein